ncbi:hypothetical protein TW95_gp0350 [Pandoravirus inopinatum]|uniref:Transmembrane protein n=1 Tax=Pandoravirus inopinatum TaxID=1605721 RepID=A0A0B5J0T8_9VIRU|nr:hypothetical protein TW95_gp0350 [Pandoravirus inopinatum]AJF97084.1 hypothetical protein [Pandoravirus inopinatum]
MHGLNAPDQSLIFLKFFKFFDLSNRAMPFLPRALVERCMRGLSCKKHTRPPAIHRHCLLFGVGVICLVALFVVGKASDSLSQRYNIVANLGPRRQQYESRQKKQKATGQKKEQT